MNKLFAYLFPVLATLLAFACLGVPAPAVAQDVLEPHEHCYKCTAWEKNPNYYSCKHVSVEGAIGHKACKLKGGAKQCNTSQNHVDFGPDCTVVLAMDGRVLPNVESEPWSQAVAGTDLPRREHQAEPSVDVALEEVRHGCTGAIIQRRYSSARIAELRTGLRRVTI